MLVLSLLYNRTTIHGTRRPFFDRKVVKEIITRAAGMSKRQSGEQSVLGQCERTKVSPFQRYDGGLAPISVAILAGGKSRRMGRDKALLDIGSQTLLEIVAMRVVSLTDDLFVVASNGHRYADLGFRVVPDVVPDSGSLGGIYSALTSASCDQCLIVGCDMPFLNASLLTFMVNQPRDYDVLIPVLAGGRSDQGHDKTYETLHAIYSRSVLPVIERLLAARQLKIADLFPMLRVRELDEPTVRRFDSDLSSFFNANSPEDFAFVERAIALGDSR